MLKSPSETVCVTHSSEPGLCPEVLLPWRKLVLHSLWQGLGLGREQEKSEGKEHENQESCGEKQVGAVGQAGLPLVALPDPRLFFVFQLLFLVQSPGTPHLDTQLVLTRQSE